MIILVDDVPDNRELAAFILEQAGFEVLTFQTGEPALEYLNRCGDDCRIEAVILDLALPTIDGLSIAERIRLNEDAFGREPVPIAFYTAHNQAPQGATERVAQRCDVERIWHKPEDTPHLADYLRDWLDNREANSKVRANYVL